MSHSIEPITCILNVVNSTAYWTFRHIILLNIPALYGQMFSTKSDLESAEDRGSLDTWWDDLLKEYNGMAGISAATVTLSMTILQTSFCAGNSTAFTCGTTTLICGLIAFAFCAMYIWLMQQFRGVQERVNWVQNTKDNNYCWRDADLILAAPAAWLLWTFMSLSVLVVFGIWSNQAVQPSETADLPSGPMKLSVAGSGCLMTLFLGGMLHLFVSSRRFRQFGRN